MKPRSRRKGSEGSLKRRTTSSRKLVEEGLRRRDFGDELKGTGELKAGKGYGGTSARFLLVVGPRGTN